MSRRLTLIRHGESIWNAVGRAQGHAPVPLSERGHEQARLTAQALQQDARYAALYCSDLLRCRQTVAPIAEALALEVVYDARLREVGAGTWQGLTWEERRAFDPENHAHFMADPVNVSLPGGESTREMMVRVQAALQDILTAHPAEDVLIVLHGGPIRAVLRYFELWEPDFWGRHLPELYNASRTVITVDASNRQAELIMLADVAHLPADLVT